METVIQFVLVLAVCGAAAGPWMTWIFVSLVGALAMPVFVGVMLWLGHGLGPSLAAALAGYVALQVGYVVSGWAVEVWRSRVLRQYGAERRGGRRETRP